MRATRIVTAAVIVLCMAGQALAQAKPAAPQAPKPAAPAPAAPSAGVTPPSDYVIGPGDVLTVTYWRDKDMTGDYPVRPDGKITLPLLNDIDAVGLTPEQLKDRLMQASSKLLVDPTITVGVKEINSRRVYITGGVQKPGPYNLLVPTDVVSLISIAGGLREFANGKNIRILRSEGGKQTSLLFNYKEVLEGKNLGQNIQLRPGDRVLVPE